MATPATLDRVRELLVERVLVRRNLDEIGMDDDLIEHWGLGSPEIMEILIGLEEEFNIELSEEEFSIERFRTVRKMATVVESLIEKIQKT